MANTSAVLERRDWVLLALLVARGYSLTPVRLQKSLFLLRERGGLRDPDAFYEFEPYAYGPFSREIYDDAATLGRERKVVAFPSSRESSRRYALTAQGLEAANALVSDDQESAGLEYLRRAVEWTEGQSFAQLVNSIYAHFPKYKENSVF